MKKFLILIILLASSFSVLAQETFSSVEERMTGKEFMETGLSNLSDQELAALNKWLRDHSVATMENRNPAARPSQPATAAVAASTPSSNSTPVATTTGDKRGFEEKDLNTDTIVANIIGEFKGWDGDTVFKLSNGQVWKQKEKGRQITKLMVNPQITIKSGMFNSWHLSVDEQQDPDCQIAQRDHCQ
jgi:hypothetical protein